MAMTESGAAELLDVDVPVGGRVLVVSDLHLTSEATAASTVATTEVAQTIDAWTGPGVLIFNGSTIELLVPGQQVAGALDAHRKLVAVVRAFAAGPGRRVLYLPGARDGRAAWDAKVMAALGQLLGAETALAAELHIQTGAGRRTVRVEPGHRLDPLSCPGDPRNPADSPLGQHLICEVLPALSGGGAGGGGGSTGGGGGGGTGRGGRGGGSDGWLAGLDSLDDPGAFPRFLASRLTYRRLGRHAWWLLLPLIAAVLLRLPLAVVRRAHTHVASASRIGVYLVLATIAELLLIGFVVAAVVRGTWRALAGVALNHGPGPRDPNAAPRGAARDLVTAGHAGLITGHTRHPELTHLGTGFYANAGCACEVVSELPARLDGVGMPSLFLAHRQVAWVELEAGNDLHVRLLHARRDLPGATVIERVLTRRNPEQGSGGTGDTHPEVVATFPQGGSWPEAADFSQRQRRVRRLSAALVALAGLLSLISAFSAPMRQRLGDVLQLVPLVVPQTANALVAVAGLGLLLLARSVRRGQRRAWLICEGLLVLAVILHLVKGVDIEEALAAAAVAAFLLVNRDVFQAGVDRPSTRRGIITLAGGAAAALATGTMGVEIGTMLARSRHHQRLPLPQAFQAAAERLVGLSSVSLPERVDDFFSPAMLTVAVCIVLAGGYLLLRPVVARRASMVAHPTAAAVSGGDGLVRARGVVRRHGSGTLDYFALRSDKQWFFWGDSLVAYGVYGGVCLVSPDPIGPVAEREETWKEFRRFADEHGWALAVLGAGEQWLPVYRASGMHDLYLGDEAVVDCTRFTLDGGRYKGLRQAVNRIAKYGYTISFHDPAAIDDTLRAQLQAVMTKSRRGDVERGFSMTLGRAFDPSDDGLLLAVVWSPPAVGASGPGEPVAFCQYVPAPGIDGFSLDLMRRDDGEHPNGLLDYVVVETIRHLEADGHRGLGLNFATMRAVLAGEAGEGMSQRIQAWVLRRMSDSMQIESLWKFNAKFDPDWQPRYALYDSPENVLPTAIAVARAESFWELPVIGRFLVPNAPDGGGNGGRGGDGPPAPEPPAPIPDTVGHPATG